MTKRNPMKAVKRQTNRGRPRMPDSFRRSRDIQVPVTPEQYRKVQKLAEAENVPMASYVRQKLGFAY